MKKPVKTPARPSVKQQSAIAAKLRRRAHVDEALREERRTGHHAGYDFQEAFFFKRGGSVRSPTR